MDERESHEVVGIIPAVTPDPPSIAVIVPSHVAAETLGACLDGLLAQTLPAHRFVAHVVDTDRDGARELVAARAAAWEGRLHYHLASGLGPGRQRNHGAGRVATPYLAFTDADCVPEPQWLEAGMAALESGATIVQGPTLTPDGSAPPAFSHAIHVPGPSPLWESCNVMYEASAFRAKGGFPTDLFDELGAHLGEDTELAWSVIRSGGLPAFAPRAIVRHAVHPPDYRRHLRYEWQCRLFPRLVSRVPELRRELLTSGVFLGPRSMRAVSALAGSALAARHRAGYGLAAPYAAHLARIAIRAPSPRAAAAGVTKHLIADSVREAALIWGSIRYRSPVL
jgi:GT2 family glycosyltransferase